MQEIKEMQVRCLGWEDPLRSAWQFTPVFLLGKSHGWRSLWGYSPRGGKESDTTETTQRMHTHTHTHTYSGFQNVNPISKETTLSTKIQFLCAISFVFSLTVFTHVQSYLFRSAPYFPIPLMIYKIQIVQNYNNKVKATHKAIHPLK